MREYNYYKPTKEVYEELCKQKVYRDLDALETTIHRQKMVIIHKVCTGIEDVQQWYDSIHFNLRLLQGMGRDQKLLWIQNEIGDELKEFEMPVNELFDNDKEDLEKEKRDIVTYTLERLFISAMRVLDYDTNHEQWYERWNDTMEDLNYLIERTYELTEADVHALLKDCIITDKSDSEVECDMFQEVSRVSEEENKNLFNKFLKKHIKNED